MSRAKPRVIIICGRACSGNLLRKPRSMMKPSTPTASPPAKAAKKEVVRLQHDGQRDIGPDHKKRTMGDIDDLHHPVDKRKAAGKQKKKGCERKPVERLDQ